MLNRYARAFFTRVLTPTARLLLGLGIGPDAVTLAGTLGVCVMALVFFPRGHFFWGTVAVTAFIFSDLLDGTMARLSGRVSKWGGFLDSTLDRFGDAAIFGGIAYYFAFVRDRTMFILAMVCLVSGAITSYARAKAESLGYAPESASRLHLVLDLVNLVEIDVGIRILAQTVRPATVRSLDAIHLATALRVRPASFVTYDKRVADAAREAGLAVETPGA